MSLSMKFPGAYFQGKDALEEFAEHTMCYGRSFLFVGSKSALRVSKEKLAHSFSGTDAAYRRQGSGASQALIPFR